MNGNAWSEKPAEVLTFKANQCNAEPLAAYEGFDAPVMFSFGCSGQLDVIICTPDVLASYIPCPL